METYETNSLEKRVVELERRLEEAQARLEQHDGRLHRIETWIRLLTGAARGFTRAEF